MSKQQPKRIVHPKEQRPAEHIRRIGRAVIALAQAQLEAEAQAEATARSAEPGQPPATKAAPRLRPRRGETQ